MLDKCEAVSYPATPALPNIAVVDVIAASITKVKCMVAAAMQVEIYQRSLQFLKQYAELQIDLFAFTPVVIRAAVYSVANASIAVTKV